MTPPGIPTYVPASRAVARGEHYAGPLPLAQLPRLAALVADRSAALDVVLDAGRDIEGQWLRGTIRGVLTLTCQRGLHPFGWTCEVATALRLVTSEAEEERVLRTSEPYLVLEDRLPLREMVEDEVLLAMPMMPRCDDPDCANRLK